MFKFLAILGNQIYLEGAFALRGSMVVLTLLAIPQFFTTLDCNNSLNHPGFLDTV